MTKIFNVGIALFFVSISALAQTRTTTQPGTWDNPATWGGQTVPNSTFGAITINHAVTIPQTVYPAGSPLVADQVTINTGGKLTINSGAEMHLNNGTGSEITINGTGTLDINGGLILNAGIAFTGTTITNVNFFSNSYLTTSTIAIPTATWNSNTNVTLQDLTSTATATAAWSSVTGNLTINCPSLGNVAINFAGLLNTLESLDIQATDGAVGGRVVLRNVTGSSTLTVNSGISVSGDSRIALATAGTQIVNLSGDFIFDPSTTNFSQGVSANGVVATINFLNGDFLMTSGEWRFCATPNNASTSATFNFQSGNMSVVAGTISSLGSGQAAVNFTAPTGNQNFDLTATSIASGSNINMTIDKSTSGGVNFTDSQTLGALNLTNGRLFLNNNNLTVNRAITSANGVIDPDNGAISIEGVGAFNGTMLFADDATMSSFTLNRAGTLDMGTVTPASDIEVGALILSAGTLQKTAGTLSIQDGGTITRTAGILTLASPIVPLGVYDLIYSNDAVLTTGSELTTSSTAIRNFTKQGSSTLTLDKDLTAGNSNGTFLISTGTFSASTFTTSLQGPVNTISSTANFAILNVNGPLTQTSATTTRITGNLAVGAAGSLGFTAGTAIFGGITTITNAGSGPIAFNIVNIASTRTLTAPPGTISIAGDFSGSGTFNNGSGTVVFNGTTTLLNSTKIFNNVTVNNASTLGGAISWRVNGSLVNNGSINFTAGTLTWGGSATFSGTPTLTTVSGLAVNSGAVLNLTLAGNMTIGGSLVLRTAPAAIFNHQTANDLTIGGTNTIGAGTSFTSMGRVIFTNAAATFAGGNTSTKSFTSLKVETGAVLTTTGNTSYTFTGTGTLEVLGTLVTPGGVVTVSGNTSIINTGISTSFRDLQISGSLTATGTLNLSGNFTNNGTFNPGTGTVVFSNALNGTKTIGGTQPATFNNIIIQDNTATPDVSISGTANLRGILSLNTNAVLDADGPGSGVLTLLSTGDNPTSDASIAALSGTSAITGNVTVQRFMSIEGVNGGRIYRYISSPVQNAPVSDMQAEIPITGSFTGTSVCSFCPANQSMFLYNENVTTDTNASGGNDMNDGYSDFPANANSETFTPGVGYSMFVPGNYLSTALWNLRGPINAGNITPVTLPSTFTSSGVAGNDGWNLVGNPYASTIDWNAASGWTKTNVGGTIYIRDNSGIGQFATWNGTVSVNGGSRYIPMGQAFWIQATATPTLTADENVKVAGQQTTFFREQPLTDVLRITLVKGTSRDETVIHFRSDAKAEYDIETDSRKMLNSSLNLSSVLTTGEDLAINSSPFVCSQPIKLKIANVTTGTHRLDFSEFETFGGTTEITLTDNFLNKTVDVISSNQYVFDVTSNPLSFGLNRFTVSFSEKALSDELQFTTQDVCQDENAFVSILNSRADVNYFILKDGLGVSDSLKGNGATIQLLVENENLMAGSNNIVVQSTSQKCLNTKSYQGGIVVNTLPAVQSTTPGKVCQQGSVTLSASALNAGDSFKWYQDEISDVVLSTTSEYKTPVISKSRTYYVSALNSSGCISSRIPVTAEVIQFENVLITQTPEGLLQSNYAEGNKWFYNGVELTSADTNIFIPEKSGTYKVEVSTMGCTSSFEYEFSITASEQHGESTSVSVYPNPVDDKVFVDVPENKSDISRILLYNTIGDMISEASLVKEGSSRRGVFDMSALPAGMYIIRVITPGHIESLKIYKK